MPQSSASKTQIVATLGPGSSQRGVLKSMLEHQMDVARLNFSWGDHAMHVAQIKLVRELEREIGRPIPIIQDLPGPRVQGADGHTYDRTATAAITDHDRDYIRCGAENGVDYVAVSFVGDAADVEAARAAVKAAGGSAKVIAKIERLAAVEAIDSVIAAADAVMVARGDLGNEVPLERIPFIQAMIIGKCNAAGKPVITATQMMLSMVDHPAPTRAEVTDVANAILQGSDAVMLSEETAAGKYPIEAVAMMERIAVEAERHLAGKRMIHPL